MSKWRYGCGEVISVWIPKGFTHVERKVECGSTGYMGDVNQCEKCAKEICPPPTPEYGDIEHYDDGY
jgi:hypothetical protein